MRQLANLGCSILFLIVGGVWLYKGFYQTTGDIADIYIRYLGGLLFGVGALWLLPFAIRLVLEARNRRSKGP